MSRELTTKVAGLSQGLCFVFDYRLCPQNPFPAALVDALLAYLSLLYPPAGSHHDPVPAERIVFAGESAGANILIALLHVIKQIQEQFGSHVPFFDRSVEVPFPKGMAGVGCPMDLTLSL